MIRLGVNIDHVATVRNARGEAYPDPIQAAAMAVLGGAENITFHLREDRRHIRDRDVQALRESIHIPLNFELALRDDVVKIALKMQPHSVTIVPEKRQELTTEGGLDVAKGKKELAAAIKKFRDAGIFTSVFVEPTEAAVRTCADLGAEAVELHTGAFCKAFDRAQSTKAKGSLLIPLQKSAAIAVKLGMQAHVGHGINYTNGMWMQLIDGIEEANVGHAIVAQALFVGLPEAVRSMRLLLNDRSLRPFTP